MTKVPYNIEAGIHRLDKLDRPDLLAEWIEVFDHLPLKGARNITLRRGLSYRIQEQKLGKLKHPIIKKLHRIVKSKDEEVGMITPKIKPQIGNQIIREWNGKTHTVMVVESGFEWSGEQYTSLSAVAHAITGARWSGPRFFGLNGKPTP
ncbi:MAG: hypothetical protein COC03_02750 [Robiginitomaculum sp.]|nr:MAG: hypothetical protein COC03_02750 [Robiginitomaculum sp.]PHQ67538.1 MAG: hypothetical protein COB92_04115 [Robiginitomaculum sp.]